MVDDKDPHPVDAHVGSRVRLRRSMLKMSQTKLGEKLGVTFQQVQKYEKGTNRISCSKLYELCLALDAQVGFFFDGYSTKADKVTGMAESSGASYDADFFSTPESVKLNLAFGRITNAALRRQMVDLTKALADETGEPEDQPIS